MANVITIHGRELVDDDKEAVVLLEAAVTRALRHTHKDGSSAEIHCTPRGTQGGSSSPEWLEFALTLKYADGGGMYIGCIQRKRSAGFEFHS